MAQSLLVKCGEEELDWDHFLGVGFDIYLAYSSLGSGLEVEERNMRDANFERLTIIEFLRSASRSQTSLPLSDLVAFSRMSCASDPMDLVYSLLGLAQDGTGTGPILVPKYSPSVSFMEVYIDLVE